MTRGDNPGTMKLMAMVGYGLMTALAVQYAGPLKAVEVAVGGLAALVPVILLLDRAEEREELGEIRRRKAAELASRRGERPDQAY